MANQLITIKEIARAALPRLIENLVFPNLVHKDFSNDFVSGKGDRIQVRKPVVLSAEEFDEAKGTSVQDINESSVEVALDKLATVDTEFSAIAAATSIDDINRIFIEPAAAALAQKINSDGLELYKDIPYVTGTAGTTPSSLEDIANVRKVLNQKNVPVSPRVAVWDTEADTKFTTVDAIVHADKSGRVKALRDGSIGKIFGLENYMSQAVKKHKSEATGTALKVSGAVEEGATSLSISGTTLTGKFVKGDVLEIAGKHYTVTKDTDEAANNAISEIFVYPALDAIKDKTEVTLVGDHTANLAFNPMAFAFVTRPLSAPSGVESYVTSYNGITLRVVKGYDMKHKKEMLSMDVLYGYKTMYPELATRVLG
ncbi:MAG: P22 coat protein [Clostridia bacterium]|nr:P22 coat protein [Clostridia bacterium]